MRKINISIIVLILFHNIFIQGQNNDLFEKEDLTPKKNAFIQRSAFFIKKYAPLLAACPTLIYFHQGIVASIQEKPYLTSICLYFIINYLCDTVLEYQEQDKLLELIKLLKEIFHYIVISIGVKNYIQHKNLFSEAVNEQDFLNSITQNTHYSFDEIAGIAMKSYQKLKHSLESKNQFIKIESEDFVLLYNIESITIDSMLYISDHDPILHNLLSLFKEDPKLYSNQLMEYVKIKITQKFQTFEQKTSSITVPIQT